ncbi:hypothetical protein WA158_005187 [Blastocystis sp. Blastoise]
MKVRASFIFAIVAIICLGFPAFVPVRAEEVESEVNAEEAADFKATTETETTEKEQETMKNPETFEFQAEVNRLMDILINSLYQNKDVFLRELISNASDAIDKIRFLSLTDSSILEGENKDELDIRISFDEAEGTLTIADKGIGMSKQDLIEHLGTVAKSGTTHFVEQLAQGADLNLIGQFGVGFYAVYLVSDKVRVVSKTVDSDQHVWESSADGTFTVGEDPRGNTLTHGSEITLYLKDDAKEYLDQAKLEELIKRFSEFITFPIYLYKSHTETVEVPIEEEEEEEDVFEGEDIEEVNAEDQEENKQENEKPKTRTEEKTVWSWEQMNKQKAIWSRDKSEISDDEYKNFYKTLNKGGEEDPLTWIHFKAEGEIDFRAILYLPSKAPSDLYDDFYSKKISNIRLYVRKVLIQDNFEDLIPRYLNFLVGVVDSDDLPLNVSREQLQQDKVLKVMGKKLVRKAIEMIKKLASEDEPEEEEKEETEEATEPEVEETKEEETTETEEKEKTDYKDFWEQFGKNIKIGVIEDSANRNKLSKLLRYKSTKSDDKWISLEQYVKNMKDWQKQIYFVSGEDLENLKNNLFLEKFEKKDVEVLYFTDPIDEYVVQNLKEFDGKTLQDITKEGVEFGDEADEAKERTKQYKSMFEDLTKWMKELLGDKVEKVEVSERLESAPAVLSTTKWGYSATMERIMKSQALQNPERAKYMQAKKILEINPRHPIIIELNNMVKADAEDETAKAFANLLFDSSLMNSGFMITEPEAFAKRVYSMMQKGMNIDSLDLAPEIEVTKDEEEEETTTAAPEAPETPEAPKAQEGQEIHFDSSNAEQMSEEEFQESLKRDRENRNEEKEEEEEDL